MADKMDEPLTKFAKGAFEKCTALSQLCPVKATVLGYAPNLGASIFFTVAFGLCTLAAIYLTIRHKTWTFGIAISAGLALETVGYAARTIMNGNPWHKDAFKIQICAIIISPTLICVSIYLTLKHISLNLNPAISRIKPRLFPLIFLPADLACLIVQAIGGGVAAAASAENRSLLNAGNNAIIAGITLQVVVLAVFGGLAVDYWIRVKAYMRCADAEPRALDMWKNGQFRKFGYAVLGAYFAVLIRCIYRYVFPCFFLLIFRNIC